jgi:hypothetical protein
MNIAFGKRNFDPISNAFVPISNADPLFPNTTSNFTASSNSCWKSWVSYIEDEVLEMKASQQERISIDSILQATWRGPYCSTGMETHTSTRTFYKTGTPECDGHLRLSSVGETRQTTLLPRCYNSIPYSPEEISYLKRMEQLEEDKPIQPFPTCEIRAEECDIQRNNFQLTFKNWLLHLRDVWFEWNDNDVDPHDLDPCILGTSSELLPMPCRNIGQWLDIRNFAATRGYFGGCRQAQEYCIANGKDSIFKDSNYCEVNVDRFVLVYFLPWYPTYPDIFVLLIAIL